MRVVWLLPLLLVSLLLVCNFALVFVCCLVLMLGLLYWCTAFCACVSYVLFCFVMLSFGFWDGIFVKVGRVRFPGEVGGLAAFSGGPLP